jgi:hypothetical protein
MKMNRNIFFLVILVAGLFLAGCASNPLVNKHMNPDVSVENHAVLYISVDINQIFIDGDSSKGGSSNPMAKSAPIILLEPGEHIINAKYKGADTERTNFMTITYNFKAGSRYFLYGAVDGNQVSLRIRDETDPEKISSQAVDRTDKINKKMSKVQYPKSVSLGIAYKVLLNDAENAAPTKFEGTWKNKDTFINFTGNAYESTIPTGNLFREAIFGIFEYDDNTITLKVLKAVVSFSGSYLGNIKQETVVYGYTITSEGLVLTSKNKPLGTFVKQNE